MKGVIFGIFKFLTPFIIMMAFENFILWTSKINHLSVVETLILFSTSAIVLVSFIIIVTMINIPVLGWRIHIIQFVETIFYWLLHKNHLVVLVDMHNKKRLSLIYASMNGKLHAKYFDAESKRLELYTDGSTNEQLIARWYYLNPELELERKIMFN